MFNEYPYTSYEKINLDWLLDLGKKLKEDAESGAFNGSRGPGIFGITTIYAEMGGYYCNKIGDAGVGDFVIGYGPAAGVNTLYLMKVTSVSGNYLEGTTLLQITGPQGPQGQQGEPGEGGLTEAQKQAILQLARKVAYIDGDGQTYYNALYAAFYGGAPVVVLDSISAVFNQGTAIIYDTDSLDTLKQYLVVTATYSDSTTATVPSADYTLSGTLTEGTSTITVAYGGKSTTFNVTVSHYDTGWVSGVPYDMTDGLTENMYLSNGVETAYNGWAISPYLRVSGAFFVSNTTINSQYCAEYDESGNYLRKPNIESGFYVGLNDYGDVVSIRVSETTSKVTNTVITPYQLDGLTDSTVIDTSKYYTPADWSDIGYINSTTGAVVPNSAYKCSDYMNCYNMTTITDNLWKVIRGYGFYDGDKNFISSVEIATADGTKGKQTSIPSGARYFRAYKPIQAPDLCFNLR